MLPSSSQLIVPTWCVYVLEHQSWKSSWSNFALVRSGSTWGWKEGKRDNKVGRRRNDEQGAAVIVVFSKSFRGKK
jgi:hypothetical protein